MRLDTHAMNWFSNLALRMHSATDEPTLFQALTPELHRQFHSAATVVEEAAYNLSTFRMHSLAGDFRLPDEYIAALDDSPMVTRWRALQPNETMHLSFMSSRAALLRTVFYAEVWRPMAFGDQLIGTFSTTPGVALNFSVQRKEMFLEQDRILLEQVRRHVRACVMRVRHSSASLPSLLCSEIHLDHRLRMMAPTPELVRLLGDYFPTDRIRASPHLLPDTLHQWVKFSLARLSVRSPLSPLTYFKSECPRGKMTTRLFPHQLHGHTLRLTEEPRAHGVLDLVARGITRRECEVLHWIIAGKQNTDIAVVLAIASRTVEKHIESLMRKFSARNRQHLAHLATERLSRPCDRAIPIRDPAG